MTVKIDMIDDNLDYWFGNKYHKYWAMALDREGKVTLRGFTYLKFSEKQESGGRTMTRRYAATAFLKVTLLSPDGAQLMGEEDLKTARLYLCGLGILDPDDEIADPPLSLA